MSRDKRSDKLSDTMAELMAMDNVAQAVDSLEVVQVRPPDLPKVIPHDILGWEPKLNPMQLKSYRSQAPFVLTHGERASGKTTGLLHKAVHHCITQYNAFALFITMNKRQGDAGLKNDMTISVFPQWVNGVNAEIQEWRLTAGSHDATCWIGNIHGGWSQIQIISIPHVAQVESKVKVLSPSFVFVDELSGFEGKEVVFWPVQQLNRRPGIVGQQQFCGATNPTGDDTWVYDMYFNEPYDDNGDLLPEYDVIHIPFSENAHNLPAAYRHNLEVMMRNDPIERARMLEGKWVSRPSGHCVFGELIDNDYHIRGDSFSGRGLKPVPGYPVIVGMDPGTRWTSIVYSQILPVGGKNVWVVFDEIVFQEKHDYRTLTFRMLAVMDKWDRLLGKKLQYIHISDSSAINMWRPGEGTFDAAVIEKYAGGRIKITGASKGAGSVNARVVLLQQALVDREIIVSAVCENVVWMLRGLEYDKRNPKKLKRSAHLHNFDALTYPMYHFQFNDTNDERKVDFYSY